MPSFSTLVGTMRAAPSDAPDGLTDLEAAAPTAHRRQSSFFEDVVYTAKRGKLAQDTRAIVQGIKTLAEGEPIDDRKFLLEHGVSLLQSLPTNSALSKTMSDAFIGTLWRDLPHPPATHLGPENTYRSADGSGNNYYMPKLGASGTPYSRSVPPCTPKPPNLPDPGVVFEALLRRDKFVEHPSGISSLFFAFATLVIHECFQTNRQQHWINDTTSYVDLSTLYGNNQEEQNKVRTFENGQIWPDVIASDRIMLMPPTVSALLVLFSRMHNWIVSRLIQINEKGKYNADLSKLSDEQKKAQDEDLFQLGRNINVGMFATVVLRDYVNVILNTIRSNSEWNLQLGGEIKTFGGQRLERGSGNACSVEFNVLYRWHAALSLADEKWTEDLFASVYPGRDPSTLTPPEFYKLFAKYGHELHEKQPKEWEIHGLKRGADGRYNDQDIANILVKAIEEPAGAFKARGSPAAFKVIDIMGIMQARETWSVCTMNEFRNFLKLKPFSTFKEWNSDPEIANAAQALYGHPDNLELYPGLLAEEAKPSMPGSGVCPGHTIARGILDDAVALVRGDRFLSHDFNVSTLTSWGMEQLTPFPGAQGGILAKVLFTVLPWTFRYNSTYAMFPFYTPKTIKEILTTNKKIKDYDTTPPGPPVVIHSINSYAKCREIFDDRDTFNVFYNNNIKKVTSPKGFLIGYDDHANHDPPKVAMEAALFQKGFEGPLAKFFATKTADLIQKKSATFSKSKERYIDIVRDVINVVPVLFVGDRFGFPLKTKETPHGLITPQELHLMLVGLFVFTSFDLIPKAGWILRETSLKSAAILHGLLEARLKMDRTGPLDRFTHFISSKTSLSESQEATAFYKELLKSKKSPSDLANDCLGTLIPIAGNLTQQTALIVDLYLRPEYEKEKTRIVELVQTNTKEADDELMGYIWEGFRLIPVVIGLPRVVAKDVIVQDGDKQVNIKKGDKIIISTSNAHMDPSVFPDPEKIDPHRPMEKYMLMGHGMHYCLGARLVGIPILSMIKEVFKLKNLRRAAGRAGHFTRITEDLNGSKAHLYLDSNSTEVPFPSSLAVMYNAE